MVNTQWMFLSCDIVAKCQIQLIGVIDFSRNRSDRVVRFSVCVCIDKCVFIGIVTPYLQDVLRQINQSFFILVTDT